MIDEKVILVEKLKDTAVQHLTEKMIEDIGKLSQEYQDALNDRIVEWVKFSHKYFSTTEFRQAYADLCQRYNIIYFNFMLGHHSKLVDDIDPWYNLSDSKLMPTRQQNYYIPNLKKAYSKMSQHSQLGVSHTSSLKGLLKRLNIKSDKRKSKRLSRRKRVKGGKICS